MSEFGYDATMIPILYEDETCLFLDKPAGLPMHGDGKTPVKTVADFVLEMYPLLSTVGEPLIVLHKGKEFTIQKPGIVHRLDKDTSGVVLIAKTQEAYEFFKKQFQNREIKKTYHAFVYGWITEDTFEITAPIGRAPGDIRRWTSGGNARSPRDAWTEFTILHRFGDRPYEGKGSTENGTYSFVEARPKTGRTHQIRVHLRSINHPIVADALYAPKRTGALGFTRMALHAKALTVTLLSGKRLTIEAPYPPDFEQALLVANG